MLSPRRSAQLGLSAASLMLVTSVTVLIAGASDSGSKPSNPSSRSDSAQVTPLASGQFGPLQSDLNSRSANSKP
jgi:hypothetical protein